MKKAVVFLAEGFEDMEAVGVIDILRRGGVDVTIAGVTNQTVTSTHNMKIVADTVIDNINPSDYDAMVCPGGMPGSTNLRDSSKVVSLIQECNKNGGYVCAICAGPMVLEKAGVLSGKNFTMYPGMAADFAPSGKYHADKLVVKDGNVITAAGPAAINSFGLNILAALIDNDTAKKIAEGMLIKEF